MRKNALTFMLMLPVLSLVGCGDPSSITIDNSSSVNGSSSFTEPISSSKNDSFVSSVPSSASLETSSSSSIDEPPAFPEAALHSLQGNLYLKGYYDISVSGDMPDRFTIETTFTNDTYYSIEMYSGITEYETSGYRNDLDLAVIYYIDEHNEIAWSYYGEDGNSDGIVSKEEAYIWSYLANPFARLATSDFTYVSDGIYALNPEYTYETAVNITNWDEQITTFTVKVAGEEVTALDFVTEETPYDEHNNYISTYHFDVESRGDEVVPLAKPAPYEETAEKTLLLTGLRDLTSNNFTVKQTEVLDGETPYTFNTYYTDEAVYCDYTDAQNLPYGLFTSDGSLYGFENSGGTLTLDGIDYTGYSLNDFKPSLIDFNVYALTEEGNGIFTAHGELAPVVASCFDSQELVSYAEEVTLVMTSGQISKVEYNFSIYDYYTGTISMEFFNIGSTTIPVNYSSLLPTI